MSNKFDWRGPAIFGTIFFLISLPIIGNYSYPQKGVIVSQAQNFREDLQKAEDYWSHNHRASNYAREGNFNNAIIEYQKSIEVIQNMPGDKWPNLKKEDVDRMNQQTRIDAQIFSRYGLIEALEKTGHYEEALQSVDWLIQNQHVKGKEELLKRKLEGMKQNLLQKMQQIQKA